MEHSQSLTNLINNPLSPSSLQNFPWSSALHGEAELPHRYVWSSDNQRPSANAAGSIPGIICHKNGLIDQVLYRLSAPPLLPQPRIGGRLMVEMVQRQLVQLQARQKEMNNGS